MTLKMAQMVPLTLLFTTLFTLISGLPTESTGHALERTKTTVTQRDLVSRAPLPGWSLYVAQDNDGAGCYVDRNPRVLPDYTTSVYPSSIEKAIEVCQEKGYKWAGVQWYDQVWCSNSIPSNLVSAPESECSTPCVSGEQCGGNWRLNIYTTTTSASSLTWSALGCYKDQDSRTLNGLYTDDGGMTPQMCQAQCADKGFKYAGVEYGYQCYCGNTINGQKTGDESCNVRCSGNNEICGGSWAISVYKLTTSVPIDPSVPEWKYIQCVTDSWDRALSTASTSAWDMTVPKCTDFCASKGLALAGLEAGNECFCASGLSLSPNAGQQVGDGECGSICGGDGEQKCGGTWRVSLYSTLADQALDAALGQGISTTESATTNAAITPTTTPAAPGPTQDTSFTISNPIPGGGRSDDKQIYAHFILGNAYPYNRNTWRRDIDRAISAGLDGFFLNIGAGDWQPARVADAYAVAQEKGFKMVLSFDMAELDCGSWNRGPLLQQYIRDYINHAAAGRYGGKSILTTFAGESCSFGQGSTNNGWNNIMGRYRNQIYFAPSYNVDPQSLPNYDINAEVSWGSAWPVAGKEIETSRDTWFMQQLRGKGYIGTVSPAFAAHLPGKNWIWRGDNFLYGARWDQLLSLRDRTDIVQVVSWNDYGESTYIDDIEGDMPGAARTYANNEFAHSALLSLQAFYSSAWKNGVYPAIDKDQIWAMARPHQAWASATGQVPAGRELTNDNLYVQVHLVSAANIVLCSGGCSTEQGQPGINRFSHPLQVGQTASARIERNGQIVARVDGTTVFSSRPARYNFNYWIKSSA